MSRGVSYPSNAEYVFYKDVSTFQDEFDWDIFIESIVSDLQSKYKSLCFDDKWLGREDRVILSNDLVFVGVSEYCGVAAIWVVLREEHLNLAWKFADTIKDNVKSFCDFCKVGSMSNGESVYRKLE